MVGELRENTLPVRLHSYAQLALIRGAIENAACAVCLLGPTTRIERVTNRLSLEWKELRPTYRLRELTDATPNRTIDDRKRQLQKLLLAAGLPYEVPAGADAAICADKAAKKALNGLDYVDIVRRGGELAGMTADAAEAAWSGCSGIAHGDASATLGLLDREIVRQDEPGVSLMRLSAPVQLMYLTAYGACILAHTGFNLYRVRATAPLSRLAH